MAGDFSGQSSVLDLFANIARLTDNFPPVPSYIVGDDEVVGERCRCISDASSISLHEGVCRLDV